MSEPRHIGEALNRLIKHARRHYAPDSAELNEVLARVLGDMLASKCYVMASSETMITLAASSEAVRQEISFYKQKLIKEFRKEYSKNLRDIMIVVKEK